MIKSQTTRNAPKSEKRTSLDSSYNYFKSIVAETLPRQNIL